MNPDSAKEKFAEAEGLYRAGEFQECLDILDELDHAFPDKKSVMLSRAQCFFKLNETGRAMKICEGILDRYDYPPAETLMIRIAERYGDAGSGFTISSDYGAEDDKSYPPADTPSETAAC